jgi:hypothetical protein
MYLHSYGRRDTARKWFQALPPEVRAGMVTADYSAAEARCPQKIPIAEVLKNASEELV